MTVARRLGRYVIRERIGRGGFSEVFLAETEGAGGFRKRVVIKRLRPALDGAERLHDKLAAEARLVTRLGHGNVVQVLDFGVDGEAPYLVMELVDGASLAELLADLERRGERLGLEEALFVVESVCAALQYAHSARDERGEPLEIVHRDVKPGNVLLSRDGVVKLSDFGIAWARADAVYDADIGLGTEGYAAPEQLAGEPVDARVDIYAVGILLGKLVAPYVAAGDPGAEALWDIVDRASQAAPADRHESAERLAGALEAWRGELGLRHRPGRLPELVDRLVAGRAHATLDLDDALEVEAPETRLLQATGAPQPATESSLPSILIATIVLALAGAAIGSSTTRAGSGTDTAPVATRAATPRGGSARGASSPPLSERATPPAVVEPDPGQAPPEPAALPSPHAPAPAPVVVEATAEPEPAAPEAAPIATPSRAARGRLRVNLLPWARVEIDGKPVGRTPVDLKLRPGKHKVTLENPDTGQKRTLQVEIEARETASITKW